MENCSERRATQASFKDAYILWVITGLECQCLLLNPLPNTNLRQDTTECPHLRTFLSSSTDVRFPQTSMLGLVKLYCHKLYYPISASDYSRGIALTGRGGFAMGQARWRSGQPGFEIWRTLTISRPEPSQIASPAITTPSRDHRDGEPAETRS
jgi:hypothetical protein